MHKIRRTKTALIVVDDVEIEKLAYSASEAFDIASTPLDAEELDGDFDTKEEFFLC